jgi:hypothetical protein
MFKIIFIDLPYVACRCIREVFGKQSRNIECVRKTFVKHMSSSWCIRNEVLGSPTPRMDLEHDECFPSMNVGVLGANGPYSGSIRSIQKPFGVFENHSETIHSESKWKAFGDTWRKFRVMARLHWAECHSECFPNINVGVLGANKPYSGSIRCILGAYWLFGCVRMHTERHSVAPTICCACSK